MLLVAVLLAVAILAVIVASLIWPPAILWLQTRDDAIRAKDVPERFRDGFLTQLFYPPNRKNRMPPIDKFLIWVVLLAVLASLYELGAGYCVTGTDGTKCLLPPDDTMLTMATVGFLILLGSEFALRFAMKGFQYMWPCGLIDLTVILLDLAILALQLGWIDVSSFMAEDPAQAAAVVMFLRLLRVARLLRALKLVRYMFEPKKRRLFWRKLKPHIKALSALTLIVMTIALTFGAIISVLNGNSPREGWQLVMSQVINNLSGGDGEEPFAVIAAVLIIAALANMIAILYAPIMSRIREEQRETENLDLLEEHIIICLNDAKTYEGFIEELAHVFGNAADRDVFVITESKDQEIDTGYVPRLKVIRGEMDDPATWRDCAAGSAELIILLGAHNVLTDMDYARFLSPGGGSHKAPSLVVRMDTPGPKDKETSLGYERRQLIENVDLVVLSRDKLIKAIEENAWSRWSLQYAYLHKLTDEYEEKLEFPDLGRITGDEAAAARITSLIEEDTGKTCTRRKHNMLVDPTKKADETIQTALEEYHDLEAIISILWAHPADAKATCVFAYVAAFELVGRNADLADYNNAHLSVFAVEFAAALAIFHETMIPRVLMGWLSDWENITRADEANAKDASSFTGTAVR